MERLLIAVLGALGLSFMLVMLLSMTVPDEGQIIWAGPFYDGEAGYSVTVDREHNVKRLAVELSMDLIESAPTSGPESHIRFDLPDDLSDQIFIDHIQIDYHPEGHPPGPYLEPHFDLHFYGISIDEQLAIDCSDRVVISGDLLPEHHIVTQPGVPPDGECVPEMGHHGIDLRSPELNPEAAVPFTKTMILGYYEGELTFIEPMITREFLRKQTSFTIPIHYPDVLPRATRYPTEFFGYYDADDGVYRFVWQKFREMR